MARHSESVLFNLCFHLESIELFFIFQSLERILYVWAIRHPASGYVQGINDLVTPFFQVFLSAFIGILHLSFVSFFDL
jgi:Rab-GTPase-TBC domain